ncbi:MAG: efflux RND transporter periplasmic adaptor subunit [Acidiferrobacteraceae bacterium]
MKFLSLVSGCLVAASALAAPRNVSLTPAQVRALGLKTVSAQVLNLARTHTLYGRFITPPDRVALVSSPINGRVIALYVGVGDQVRRGEPVARVESLLAGNPAPSVLLRAPIRGVVERRHAVLGQAVASRTALFRLIAPRVLWLQAHAYQDQLHGLKRGDQARIQVLGNSGVFTGHLVRLSPRISSASDTETVWIQVQNKKGVLLPRLFAKAIVTLKRIRGVAVPASALLDINGQYGLFIATGPNRYQYQRVRIGVRTHDDVQVLNLAPGTRVVTQGNGALYTLLFAGSHLHADS